MGRLFYLNAANTIALLTCALAYLAPVFTRYTYTIGGEPALSLGNNLFFPKWTLLGSDDERLYAQVDPKDWTKFEVNLMKELNEAYYPEAVIEDTTRVVVQVMAGLTVACLLGALFCTSCVEKVFPARILSISGFVFSLLVWILHLQTEFLDNAEAFCDGPGRTSKQTIYGFTVVGTPSKNLASCEISGMTYTNIFVKDQEEITFYSLSAGFYLSIVASVFAFIGFFLTFAKYKTEDEYEEEGDAELKGDTYIYE